MSSSDDEDDRHSNRSDSSVANNPRKAVDAAPSAAARPQSFAQTATLQPGALPPLDAINLKFSQIHDGILSLARMIEADGDRSMATWPEILSKYNFLVSQSHILSQTLSNSVPSVEDHSSDPRTRRPPLSNLPRLVLHPTSPTPEDQSQDFRVGTLLRTALVPDMAEREAHIFKAFGAPHRGSDEDETAVLHHLESIRTAHDAGVSRILEKATAFREQYDWTSRVSVAPPEDAPHSPSIILPVASPNAAATIPGVTGEGVGVEEGGSDIFGDAGGSDSGSGDDNTTDNEAFLLEAELEDGGDGVGATPSAAPSVTSEV